MITALLIMSIVLGVLVWAASPAIGGSVNDPEIADAAADTTNPTLDITKAWVHDETERTILYTVEVSELTPPPEADYQYHLHFVDQQQPKGVGVGSAPSEQGTLYQVVGTVHPDGNVTGLVEVWVERGDSGYWKLVGEANARTSLDTNRVTVTVPRQATGSPLQGDRLTGFFAHTYASASHDISKAQEVGDTAVGVRSQYRFHRSTATDDSEDVGSLSFDSPVSLVIVGVAGILLGVFLSIVLSPVRRR